jgi:hypothetical protein
MSENKDPYYELKIKIAEELKCNVSELIEVSDHSCIAEGLCFEAKRPDNKDLYLKPILEAALFKMLTKEAYKQGFDNLPESQFFEPHGIVRLDSMFGTIYLVLESYPWLIMKKPYNFDQYYGQEA